MIITKITCGIITKCMLVQNFTNNYLNNIWGKISVLVDFQLLERIQVYR